MCVQWTLFIQVLLGLTEVLTVLQCSLKSSYKNSQIYSSRNIFPTASRFTHRSGPSYAPVSVPVSALGLTDRSQPIRSSASSADAADVELVSQQKSNVTFLKLWILYHKLQMNILANGPIWFGISISRAKVYIVIVVYPWAKEMFQYKILLIQDTDCLFKQLNAMPLKIVNVDMGFTYVPNFCLFTSILYALCSFNITYS